MPQFRYQALNADNQPVAGEILADSVAQAIVQLEAAGLSVQSIGYATGERPSVSLPSTRNSLPAFTAAEQAAIEAHLLRIVERGRDLMPALAAYAAEMSRSPQRRELLELIRILQSGELSQAAAALQPRPDYWIPLVAAAGDSNDEGPFLDAVLREFPQSGQVSPWGRAWVIYPATAIGFAMAVFLFIGAFVVPVFRDLFAGFGLKLPALTQLVLTFYSAIISGTFIVTAIFLGIVAIVASRIATSANKTIGGRHGAKPLTRSLAIAEFARHLATLLDANFAPATSMRLANSAIRRPALKRAVARIADDLASPGSMAAAADRRAVPATVLFALQHEMPLPARSAVLREISRCYTDRSAAVFSWTRGAFEPLAILVVGFLIAMTVIGLYLPLLSLLQALS